MMLSLETEMTTWPWQRSHEVPLRRSPAGLGSPPCRENKQAGVPCRQCMRAPSQLQRKQKASGGHSRRPQPLSRSSVQSWQPAAQSSPTPAARRMPLSVRLKARRGAHCTALHCTAHAGRTTCVWLLPPLSCAVMMTAVAAAGSCCSPQTRSFIVPAVERAASGMASAPCREMEELARREAAAQASVAELSKALAEAELARAAAEQAAAEAAPAHAQLCADFDECRNVLEARDAQAHELSAHLHVNAHRLSVRALRHLPCHSCTCRAAAAAACS